MWLDPAQRIGEHEEKARGREHRHGQKGGAKCFTDVGLDFGLLNRRERGPDMPSMLDHRCKDTGDFRIPDGENREQNGCHKSGPEGRADQT